MMKHKGDWLLLLAAFIGGGGFISLKYLLDWGYEPVSGDFRAFSDGIRLHVSGLLQTAETN